MTATPESLPARRPRKKGRADRRAVRTEAHYTPLDPEVRAPRQGWRIVAGKEFGDCLTSIRFVVLVLILGLAAALAVYSAAAEIRDVANNVSGHPSVFLALFTLAGENVPAFAFLISFLGPLLGIAFGFDGINGERAEGTLPRLLAQPIHRDDVINGKFVGALAAIGLMLTAITLIVAALGIVQLGVVPQPDSILRLLMWLAVAIVYVGFWLAFALLCSVMLRRAATSALVAIALWLVLTLFATLLVGLIAGFLAPVPPDATAAQQLANESLQLQLGWLSPSRLFEDSTAALLNPSVRTVGLVLPVQADRAVTSILGLDQSLLVVWPQVVALVGLTVVSFALAYISFMRQEVRA
ncbi:MAG: ABC transporter permease [Chloroflexota bacterium]|nr:ABC transporter permease [Chloroflexota bacterium]